ncbi:MAG: hypothetical protein OXQ29_00275, partial [Rhodospirillaceae bacterium]|nr:hypothetical protein [Rhodospirillaceae bacterium]
MALDVLITADGLAQGSKNPLALLLVDFDVVQSSTMEYRVRVSEHDLELGEQVIDHSTVSPLRFTFRGMTSNVRSVEGGDSSFARSRGSWEQLERLTLARDPLTVTTPFGEYAAMLITGLRHERRPGSGHALFFELSFQQVRFVSGERSVVIAPPERTDLPGGGPGVGNGPPVDRGDVAVGADDGGDLGVRILLMAGNSQSLRVVLSGLSVEMSVLWNPIPDGTWHLYSDPGRLAGALLAPGIKVPSRDPA